MTDSYSKARTKIPSPPQIAESGATH